MYHTQSVNGGFHKKEIKQTADTIIYLVEKMSQQKSIFKLLLKKQKEFRDNL